ncbi:hypothetical protein MBLNU459_g0511t1 [Dothideomycetes sp. NU459]
MSASTPPLTLIVAATAKNGIGKDGGLPWPMLKKEMAYFARITKRVPRSSAQQQASAKTNNKGTQQSPEPARQQPHQNVVIMGRKTWDSIPPRFRPLAGRTNLVISRQASLPSASASAGDVLVASSIAGGLAALAARIEAGEAKPMGRVFVIGGSAIYRAALEMESARHVLLTRVRGEWECDTEFPVELEGSGGGGGAGWVRRDKGRLEEFVEEELESAVLEEEVKGQKIGYEFLLYERV